jgi:hypothetical protein
MAYGYAQGGHSTEAGKVLKLAASPTERASILSEMAAGYARGGHITEAGKVLQLASPAERTFILKYIAAGYAQGGHITEVGKVLELAENLAERASLLNEMAYGYARGSYTTEAGKVLQLASPAERASILNEMALGYAQRGHTTEAGKVLELAASPAEHSLILRHIVRGSKLSGKELSQSIALQGFATANNDNARTALFTELNESKAATSYELAKLIPRAQKISQVMAMSIGTTVEKLNYRQGLAWTQPELQIWFLQCVNLVKTEKLSTEIFLSIASYLSPLSINEATLLTNRLYVHTFAGRFFKNLSNQHHLLAASCQPQQSSTNASSSSSCSKVADTSIQKKGKGSIM